MRPRFFSPAPIAVVLVLACLTACGESSSQDGSSESEETAAAPTGDPVTDMRAAIDALMARGEHGAAAVEVQHILIGFDGTVAGATRSQAEAEALAADLVVQIDGGADFGELVREHTDDSAPGIYDMTTTTRRGMVAGFGDVGWRLQVGEVGVSPYDSGKSPFGWHIIKRLK